MTLRPVSPTDAELARFCGLPGLGELSPQMVRLHAPDASWLLEQNGAATARCSLWWSAAPQLPGKRIGLIGHYAARDAAAAAAILRGACERLRGAGCDLAVGPMDGSTWRRYRLLTWRGIDPPFFLEPDNPDAWPGHFAAGGFAPLATYYSSKCDDLGAYRADEALAGRMSSAGYRSRPLDMAAVDRELGGLWRIATDAFAGNFLYTPVAEREFRQMYAPAIAVVRPELVRVIEHRSDPVAFAFAVPDMLQPARGEPQDTLILKTLAVVSDRHGQGIGNWVVDSMLVQAREMGFRRAVFALMHETNPSRRLGRGRMREIRRYTLFARPL